MDQDLGNKAGAQSSLKDKDDPLKPSVAELDTTLGEEAEVTSLTSSPLQCLVEAPCGSRPWSLAGLGRTCQQLKQRAGMSHFGLALGLDTLHTCPAERVTDGRGAGRFTPGPSWLGEVR